MKLEVTGNVSEVWTDLALHRLVRLVNVFHPESLCSTFPRPKLAGLTV